MTRQQLIDRWNVSAIEIKAAIVIAVGFFALRLAYGVSLKGVLLAFGLTAIEVGAAFTLDARAKRFRADQAEHDAVCGRIDQQYGHVDAAADEAADATDTSETKQTELNGVTAAIDLRKTMAFNLVVVVRVAIAHALAGYRAGIAHNRIRHSGGFSAVGA